MYSRIPYLNNDWSSWAIHRFFLRRLLYYTAVWLGASPSVPFTAVDVWLVRSAWLFASGWYPLVKWSLISRVVPREWKKWETNSKPWSDVTWDETLCFDKTWITKRCTSSTEVMVSWVGMNMACFDRWSTIMRMVSKPEKKGSFSIKSIEIEFHGCSRIESCWRDLYGLWCCGLDLIQVMQDLQNFCTSSRMFGQV